MNSYKEKDLNKVIRFLAGELNDEETRKLNENLQEDRQFRQDMAELLVQHIEFAEITKRTDLTTISGKQPKERKFYKIFLTAAASLVLFFSIWQIFFRYPQPEVSDTIKVTSGGKLMRGTDLETGEKAGEIKLGGYCDIRISKKSRIRLEGKKNKEQIFLEQGESECRVEKNKGSFIVRTDLGKIKVLGTHFVVRIYKDSQKIGEEAMNLKKMFVKVITGAVMLSSAYGDDILIKKGEEVVVDKKNGIQKIEISGIPSWVEKYAQEKNHKDVPTFLSRIAGRKSYFRRKGKEEPAKKQTNLSFEVVDYETGKPLPEILVFSEGQYAFTDKDGKSPELKIEVPEDAWELSFNSVHPDYVPAALFRGIKVGIKDKQVIRLALIKNPTVTTRGIVLDPEGNPVKGACVSVFYQEDADDDSWTQVIDPNSGPEVPDYPKTKEIKGQTFFVSDVNEFFFGLHNNATRSGGEKGFTFTFPPIENVEKYKVVASYPNIGIAYQVVSKNNLNGIELKLKAAGGITVAGTIFDEGGKPKPEVELSDEHSSAKAKTDENGRFSFQYCYPNMYYFDIRMRTQDGKRPPSIYNGSSAYSAQKLDDLKVYSNPEDIKREEAKGMQQGSTDSNDKYSRVASERKALKALGAADFYKGVDEFTRSLLFGIAQNNKNNYSNRALCYLGKGETDKALMDCEKAIQANPLERYHYFIRGWVYGLGNNWQKALLNFEKCTALADDPYDAMSQYIATKKLGKENSAVLTEVKSKIKNIWPAPIFDLLQGNISFEECLKKVGDNVNQKTEAYFWAANNEQDQDKAKEYFAKAIESGGTATLEYVFTRIKQGGNINPPEKDVSLKSGTVMYIDFDKSGLKEDWNPAQGTLEMAWEAIPALPIEIKGPTGNGLSVSTKGKTFIYTNKDKLPLPQDIKDCEAISFWVYNKKNGAKPNLEIQFLESGGQGKFWRRVAITKPSWQKITVPLRFMRWGNTKAPNWNKIQFFGIYFRDAADIIIDNVAFTKGTDKKSTVSVEEMAEIAFPGKEIQTLKILDTPDIRVISDSENLEIQKLTEHLNKFVSAFKQDFPFIKTPASPPTLLIFDSKKDYRNFTPRFAGMMSAQGTSPTSGGYTFMGIAQSYWNKKYGTLRPVYGHEFLHAYVELATSLPSSSGDWVQEGIANYYQIKIHPQDNFKSIVKSGIASPAQHTQLEQLLNGKRIKMDRYWQALTVIDLLINDQNYKDSLSDLMSAFEKSGSTDLSPHLALLKTDWEKLDQDWKKFCKRKQ